MANEERLLRLENSFVTLVELLENHGERFDGLAGAHAELAAAQANSEAKIAALADAQIRTEGALESLAGKMETLAGRVVEVTEKEVELAANMSTLAANTSTLAANMSTLAAAQTRQAEAQTHTDQRLDALIDIVRKRSESESQS
jgi:hypothetical protein